MTEQNIRDLACAVVLQAVKDYFKTTSPQKKKVILKDLRSSWMDSFTNGTSVHVAEQIEKHPKEIAERLKRNYKTED